jgi:hypothetical protein
MRFLVDADLPRRTVELIRSFGHDAADVRDIGLRAADDVCIAAYAQRHSLCLISGDFGFGDIRNYPPADYAGLVVLRLPRDATAKFILHLAESLLGQPEVLGRLPGRLAIVEAGRVRLRSA